MFEITAEDLDRILADFGAGGRAVAFSELQRYHYERRDPNSREVRLIVKVETEQAGAVVVRFKREEDVTLELLEEQSTFASLLERRGIETPAQYRAGGRFARWYTIGGYDVMVTVEKFVEGQLSCVDVATAQETGALLGRMHNIAREEDCHVRGRVLFDPLGENDLFDFGEFQAKRKNLEALEPGLYQDIVATAQEYLGILPEFDAEGHWPVQGDISDCNMYRTADGRLGVFDFNRSGDNNLYFDAVMQGVFEARLMDYPQEYGENSEEIILPAFLEGYHQERPFTQRQREVYPYLYALIHAFWSMDLKWREDSLANAVERDEEAAQRAWLEEIHRRLHTLPAMPLPV